MGYLKRRIIEQMEPQEEPPMEVQRWISVRDELPKDDVAVLCACFGKSGVPLFYAAAKYFRNGYYGKNYWIDEDCIINHPTHWIPIPIYTQETK